MRVSVVVTASRKQHAELVNKNISELYLGSHEAELIVMVDGRLLGTGWVEVPEGKFFNVTVKHMGHTNTPTKGNVPRIRDHISQIRNESKSFVGDTDFVYSWEDDTELPKNSLVRLLDGFSELSREGEVGLVSGVQCGRHGLRMLGAWRANSYQFPSELTTLGMDELTGEPVEVDGTGMYCYLTPTKLYKEAVYGWKEPVGPDAWYGFYLRIKGYKNYVLTDLVCGHRTGDGKDVGFQTLVPDSKVVKARFYFDKGRWTHSIVS